MYSFLVKNVVKKYLLHVEGYASQNTNYVMLNCDTFWKQDVKMIWLKMTFTETQENILLSI